MKELTPPDLRPPFARYAHGVEIPANWRLVQTSGQLGIHPDDSIPESAYDQAMLCFENLRKILAAADMTPADVAHISAYVTDRAHMAGYMQARDAFVASGNGEENGGDGGGRLPSSTLVIVSGFTRPEFKVEVEILAAAP